LFVIIKCHFILPERIYENHGSDNLCFQIMFLFG